MALVSLVQAKQHLRITSYDSDNDVMLKVIQASDIVIDYLKSQADPAWTEDTVPGPVQAAVLLVLAHLHENRGDDMANDERLWEAVGRLLMRFRDPALA